MRHPDLMRLLRFLAIGVLNTAVGYAIYAVLVLVGLSPQPALALAFALGILWNYMTHARLVFTESARGLKRLPAYAACYALIYLLNAVALDRAIGAGLSPLVAQALLAPFAALLSFVMIGKVLTGRFPFSRT